MEWPVFLTQPDGDQPGLLTPPPEPWAGEPLPEELTTRLRPREVPTWVGHPIGRPKWHTTGTRYRAAGYLAMFGSIGVYAGAVNGSAIAILIGVTFVGLVPFLLAHSPLRRKRRRLRTWWVLTPERFGGLCLAEPVKEVWIERGQVRDVTVRGLRKDGSGTLVVASDPGHYFESGGMDWIGGVVVGRIADAESVAEQLRLLRYELS